MVDRHNQRAALVAVLLLAMLVPASAAAERMARHWAKACNLNGTPSSVVVDVYDDDNLTNPTPILATIANTDVVRMGTTDCYRVDLATTAAAITYPDIDEPTERHYTLVWRDDGTQEIKTSESVLGLAGVDPADGYCEQQTPVYATSPDPARGITWAVISMGKPSHLIIEVACDHVFATPDRIYYQVLSYNTDATVALSTPSDTAP